MIFTQRERILVLLCVCVILIGAFAWFYYLPQSQQIADLEEQNRSLESEIEQLRAIPATAAPDPADAEKALQEMEASFPLKPDQVTVLDILNKAAKGTDLVIKSMSHSDKSSNTSERAGKLVFDVSTSGNFHDTMDFLTKLEEDTRISAVQNIVLNAVKRTADSSGPSVTVTESSSETVAESQPVYFLQPLLMPTPKSAVAQPETEKPAATNAPVDSEKRQALNLVPGKVEMKMQVVFYYYNEKAAAEKNNKTSQGSTAK
ncbi:MAG: type 4a pilus biogenesis protein PilO [Syntrophomonadaceae bacterium]|jgi:Tfp pilus assembly protein PilO|nr:type 4a pilus biogenesis protein PilO [Syntrophomonadaceae bacterium]